MGPEYPGAPRRNSRNGYQIPPGPEAQTAKPDSTSVPSSAPSRQATRALEGGEGR